MDQESNEATPSALASLTQVTSLSKILAAVVFIILPFVGFLFGYSYNDDSSTVSQEETTMSRTNNTENSESWNLAEIDTESKVIPCNANEGYEGYEVPVPVYNNSSYEIGYTRPVENDTKVEGITQLSSRERFPYMTHCRVSLIEKPYQGIPKIVIPDLLKLMVDQGLPDHLRGTPRPYIFLDSQHLIFGGNGYEGAVGGFYSFDIKTQKFTPLTERSLGEPGAVVMSPLHRQILINQGDDRLLVVNAESLTSRIIPISDLNENETVIAYCGMECHSDIGWIDENIIWYAIYKKRDNTHENEFVRVSYIKLE